MNRKIVFATAVAVCLAAEASGQVIATPITERSPQPALDLGVRLEAGQIWRQRLQLGLEQLEAEDAPRAKLEFSLRLECREVTESGYRIEAAFHDWLFDFRARGGRASWDGGKMRFEGWPLDRAESSCRTLLAAWAEGLRRADLRFELARDGSILELHGLEPLEEEVRHALGEIGSVPTGMLAYFGETGLQRFRDSVQMSLFVARPTEPVEHGREWQSRCPISGLLCGPADLVRNYRLEGVEKERRHRLAVVDLQPRMETASLVSGTAEDRLDSARDDVVTTAQAEAGQVPEKQPVHRLRLLLESGLTFSLDLVVEEPIPSGGGRVRFELHTNLIE